MVFVGEWLWRQRHFWAWPLYILFKCDVRRRLHCLVLTDTNLYKFTIGKTYLVNRRWRHTTCLQHPCYDVGCYPWMLTIYTMQYKCIYVIKKLLSSLSFLHTLGTDPILIRALGVCIVLYSVSPQLKSHNNLNPQVHTPKLYRSYMFDIRASYGIASASIKLHSANTISLHGVSGSAQFINHLKLCLSPP